MLEVEIVSKGSPRNGSNDIILEADDRENGTMTNASDSVIQIDDLGYNGVVIETVETEPSDDATVVENGANEPELNQPNANEIESDKIITQNTSDTYNSNNG